MCLKLFLWCDYADMIIAEDRIHVQKLLQKLTTDEMDSGLDRLCQTWKTLEKAQLDYFFFKILKLNKILEYLKGNSFNELHNLLPTKDEQF